MPYISVGSVRENPPGADVSGVEKAVMTSLNMARAKAARALNKWDDESAKAVPVPHQQDIHPQQSSKLVNSDAELQALLSAFSELTNREREVLFALCDGGSNERVADRLCIALPTLRTHLMRLHQKLGTSGKSELVGLAWSQLTEAYRRGVLGGGVPSNGQAREVKPQGKVGGR